MKICDLEEGKKIDELIAEVTTIGEVRKIITKFGKNSQVADATLKDSSGTVILALWNDDIEKVRQGDTIKIQNGWCSSFKDNLQISAGKFGKLIVMNQTELEGI